jgi:hypothetical protein
VCADDGGVLLHILDPHYSSPEGFDFGQDDRLRDVDAAAEALVMWARDKASGYRYTLKEVTADLYPASTVSIA